MKIEIVSFSLEVFVFVRVNIVGGINGKIIRRVVMTYVFLFIFYNLLIICLILYIL